MRISLKNYKIIRAMKRLSIASAFILLTAVMAYAQPMTLAFKYAKGQEYNYKIEAKTQTISEINGQDRQNSSSSSQQVLLTVENNSANGDITFISKWLNFENSMKFNNRDTTMRMNNLIGKRSRIVVSGTGKILSTSMIDTVAFEMPRAGRQGNRQGGPGGMMFRGGRGGGNTPIRLFYLPSNKVAPGDNWQISLSDTTFDQSKNPTVTKTNIKYKLGKKETKNGVECFKITYTGKKSTAGKTVRGGNESTQDSQSDLKGTIWFDQVNGIIIEEDFREDTASTMAMTGDRSMLVPSTSFLEGTYTLVK